MDETSIEWLARELEAWAGREASHSKKHLLSRAAHLLREQDRVMSGQTTAMLALMKLKNALN